MRRLRVYAFDPQASVELDTAIINDAVIHLPWESRWESPLKIGPENDYLKVIDFDPASNVFYAPVDLDDPVLLAQDGLPPSEGRPQFHQQMVFAVAMRTIRAFERALGRKIMWAGDEEARKIREAASGPGGQETLEEVFTRQLLIYPHALREANAYYSPQKRALLFGYFRPHADDETIDASWVFTCLSQDIVAHETTHAILHGMQQRSIEPSNIDALAFHEAFADIIALLQHFSMSDVLKHQLGASGGSLRARGLLTGLAQQFGKATGHRGALRSALDLLQHDAEERDLQRSAAGTGAQPGAVAGEKRDEKSSLHDAREPHKRGGFLVAAVFDAFVTIYEGRTRDLLRIAGIIPGTRASGGALRSDLVTRLASEAAKAADHVLRMCVRALDYVPPVDLRFGEYLRAIVTADVDLVPDDPMRYRVAFVEAFRKRGIRVPGCLSMAPDSLLWDPPPPDIVKQFKVVQPGAEDPLSALFMGLLGELQLGIEFGHGRGNDLVWRAGDFSGKRNLRDLSMRVAMYNRKRIDDWFAWETDADVYWERLLGLRLLPLVHKIRENVRKREKAEGFETNEFAPMGSIDHGADDGKAPDLRSPLVEVHSARVARRAGPNGEELHQLIVQITQRRRAYFDKDEQEAAEKSDIAKIGKIRWEHPDFWFRGGATIHVDLRDGRVMRVIRKRIDDEDRLEEQRRFRCGDDVAFAMANPMRAEPLAFLHRSPS